MPNFLSLSNSSRSSFHSDRSPTFHKRSPVPKIRRPESPNDRINTRPSPASWADTPFPLITPPCRKEMSETAVISIASDMVNIHNMLIRGLNSILLQAPFIPDSSKPGYPSDDVKDLLYYVSAWCNTLEHHHQAEETTFFPLIEKMTGIVDLMDELQEQHEAFEYGLAVLKDYVERTVSKPHHYRWATMKTMIDAFAPSLVYHLHDEIDFLLCMDKFDGEGLRRCWAETHRVACQNEDPKMLNQIWPFIIGNSDKTFEGGNNFPVLPKSLRYGVKLWFASKHRGAWRFNSCDFSSRPVPLRMLPENRDDE